MKINYRRSCGIVAALCILIPFGLLTFFFASYPSTERMTRSYLDAIVAGDVERAFGISVGSPPPVCRQATRRMIEEDIRQFGGVDIQNITVRSAMNPGSNDTQEFGYAEFEFRELVESIYQTGSLTIITDHRDFGFRYLCGR